MQGAILCGKDTRGGEVLSHGTLDLAAWRAADEGVGSLTAAITHHPVSFRYHLMFLLGGGGGCVGG